MMVIIPTVAFLAGVIVGAVLGITSYRRQLFKRLDELL